MYGELGVLLTDGERIQCHVCGRFFKALGCHIFKIHGFTGDEYKKEFSLNRSQGLAAPESQAKYRKQAGRLRKYQSLGHAIIIRKNIRDNAGRFERRHQTILKRREIMRHPEVLKKLRDNLKNGKHPLLSPESKIKAAESRRTDEFRSAMSMRGKQHGFGNRKTLEKAIACRWPKRNKSG